MKTQLNFYTDLPVKAHTCTRQAIFKWKALLVFEHFTALLSVTHLNTLTAGSHWVRSAHESKYKLIFQMA